MKRIVALLLALLAMGCYDRPDGQPEQRMEALFCAAGSCMAVFKYIDRSNGVTCYVALGSYRGGISCLRDVQP